MTGQLAFDGTERSLHPSVVFTGHYGRNDGLIANVARLYIADGATVLDVSWGNGGFWRRCDTDRFRLIGSDLHALTGIQARADYRQLPYRQAIADVVVIDPPYVPVTSKADRVIHATYRNNVSGLGQHYSDILELYRGSMTEAMRVLRPGGTCWVKCQDLVNGKQQHWSIINIHALGAELGYRVDDLFVLINPQPPGAWRSERQYHARRNHSYLWIFRKRRR